MTANAWQDAARPQMHGKTQLPQQLARVPEVPFSAKRSIAPTLMRAMESNTGEHKVYDNRNRQRYTCARWQDAYRSEAEKLAERSA